MKKPGLHSVPVEEERVVSRAIEAGEIPCQVTGASRPQRITSSTFRAVPHAVPSVEKSHRKGSLILYQLAHSPFCIPVKRILDAWSVRYEVCEISPWDRRSLIDLTKGAYYQVPVIECGDRIVHETVTDPLAVAHFLDIKFAKGTLFPTSCQGLQEVVIEHIEGTLEGMGFKLSDPHVLDYIEDLGDRVMSVRHKERRFGIGCVDLWRSEAPALKKEFEDALQSYELRLRQEPFLFGAEPVYADFALYGVIGNAEFNGHYQLDSSLGNLRHWQSELAEYSRG